MYRSYGGTVLDCKDSITFFVFQVMRPAEIKKRAMDPLYSERLLEEALSDISENAHARKLQHVEPHPGRGTTTRRAAFHFVTYKILQDFV